MVLSSRNQRANLPTFPSYKFRAQVERKTQRFNLQVARIVCRPSREASIHAGNLHILQAKHGIFLHRKLPGFPGQGWT